ncbi:hypothetical protein [Paraburkholderia caribensis]|uniref:hypothetical protein n=1 Tax=Paraburkholderia caribensis TaxID=75105 RepID=UPI0007217658|nr:hypothetical protein [Paraburkholderia caribensis]ALP62394.1 hypothetical protein AN416_07135 [Paraburkholderia caribensis]AUT52379.1 hypothetical protein C2L66_11285 [Paraburkholderia caribensis]
MTTIRETFVSSIMDALKSDAQLQSSGVVVERSIYEAVDREEPKVVVVSRGRDIVLASTIGRTTRQCDLLVSAVVRDPAPDRAADVIFERSHPIVMAFDGPEIVGVEEVTTDEPETADIDGGVGIVTMRYTIQYQTPPNSLL